MDELKSSFKKSGTYGILIFLNFSFAILIIAFLIWIENRADNDQTMEPTALLIAFVSAMLIQSILLFFFFSQCKAITVNADEIRFANPLFPYVSKLYFWSDFDYFILVAEETEHSKIEAIWLIKDELLITRISSGIYTNYEALKRMIPVKNAGYKNVGFSLQAKAILGLKANLESALK